jgi:Holliday junction resolvasome RuvABC ATP-dependent DNA helicase subunit
MDNDRRLGLLGEIFHHFWKILIRRNRRRLGDIRKQTHAGSGCDAGDHSTAQHTPQEAATIHQIHGPFLLLLRLTVRQCQQRPLTQNAIPHLGCCLARG